MNPWKERTGWIALAAVLLLGLGLRIGWAMRQPSDPTAIDSLPDQREYLELAKNLRSAGEFWFADPRFRQPAYAYRTPGYPWFIVACRASPTVVRIVQAALDTSTILAIFLLARRWLSPGRAAAAAALVAINPFLIFFTGLILTETLFTAMLVWGMTLLVLSGGPWPQQPWRRWTWLGGGLLLALSALVRPSAVALPVVLGCMAALVNRSHPAPRLGRWPLPVAATMLLLTVMVLFPWAARNRWVLKSWLWTSTNAGITQYDGFNPDATGASDQRFVDAMPWTRDMTELGRSRYFTKLADDWIATHARQSAKLAVVKIARTWSPIPLGSQYASRKTYVIVGLIFAGVLDVLVLAGLAWGNLPRSAKWLLVMPALYLTALAALSVGSLRYRIPAEAPMAIVAASAASRKRAPSPVVHGIETC